PRDLPCLSGGTPTLPCPRPGGPGGGGASLGTLAGPLGAPPEPPGGGGNAVATRAWVVARLVCPVRALPCRPPDHPPPCPLGPGHAGGPRDALGWGPRLAGPVGPHAALPHAVQRPGAGRVRPGPAPRRLCRRDDRKGATRLADGHPRHHCPGPVPPGGLY